MPKWWKLLLLLVPLFLLRLAFGLWAKPVQPIADEVQTYLLGLKYFTTGLWPFYGNDVIKPPDNLELLTQDPGALEPLLLGLPFKVWPFPITPFILLNLITFAAHGFLAWYACKRLPKLSPWFIFPWVLTAPWFIHYSTSMINLSYSIAAGDLFFVAFLETLPALSLRWIPLPWANALMGFSFSWWMQFHRTWIILPPMILLSFYLQWKENHKWNGPVFFCLGALPLSLLVVPTLLQPDYHFFQYSSGLSFGFNLHNFFLFFVTLAQFLAMACFEMARFIGLHTSDRARFLAQQWTLWPGFILWGFGFVQVLLLAGYLLVRRKAPSDWGPIRLLLVSVFLWIFVSLLFTTKNPDINTFCEMMPVVMLYSLYIWEQWWDTRWGKPLLTFFLGCSLVFQASYVFIQRPQKQSFYLQYRDVMAQAIEKGDYHILAERRKGSLY
jgi:hypothetical protein